MADYERIRYETTPQAIWITLARPDELNLVDSRLFEELRDAFVRAARDEEHSAVVLRGSGRMFSGGGDLGSDVARMALEGMTEDDVSQMHEHVYAEYPAFAAIEDCPKTTIAAINGDAFGAAVDIIMMCDLAVAVRGAKLSFAPGKWGLCDAPNSGRLHRRIGLSRAKDLLFTARAVEAEEARELGLVNRVCAPDALDAAVVELVEAVLTTSPEARRLMKQVMHRDLPALRPEEHFESSIGEDFHEGVRAFTQKRPPEWTAEAIARRAMLPSPADGESASTASGNGHGGRPAVTTPASERSS